MSKFILKTKYSLSGNQPNAIKQLLRGIKRGEAHQTLLGVTGSGKTFAIANVIERVQKPTLVIAHNKTLAAQLASEYREFFPDAAVHYFVSYYDYYQPEAYMPITDTYIEKEAMINEDIERLRHAATQALLTRKDVIIVASVSCIYGLGSPYEYEKVNLRLDVGANNTRAELIRKLIYMHFERTTADLSPGTFRALGNVVEIMPASERVIYRISFKGKAILNIQKLDYITREELSSEKSIFIFPAKHYVMPEGVVKKAISDIRSELKQQLAKFERAGKVLEAERIKRRTRQDITMIKEFGYCNGIENYSRHFDRRKEGEPPHTLLSYFAKNGDFLTVIDESHVTIPQIGGMYAGDRARKKTLIEHGFRLPSALDNRPLTFKEFEERVGQVIYTSATPGKYEIEHSNKPVEMIVRPTGLVDPEIEIRGIVQNVGTSDVPTYGGQVQDFIKTAELVTKRGGRTLVTVLTKKMAEDLTDFLEDKHIKAKYIHSDIKTIERIEILTSFRKGEFDVLVGVNLLREGLDLPEVELVCILDADKEGFLRSETSLIQTMGRAARNVFGRVILYADVLTGSIERAVGESKRRRKIQIAYNKKHNITPKTIQSKIKDITGDIQKTRERAVSKLAEMDANTFGGDIKKLIKEKKNQMRSAAERLDFETAALLRDEVKVLENR